MYIDIDALIENAPDNFVIRDALCRCYEIVNEHNNMCLLLHHTRDVLHRIYGYGVGESVSMLSRSQNLLKPLILGLRARLNAENADMHCPCEITHANAVRMQGIMYVPENI